jgi:serine carboxypeptidase-like clade 2
VNCVAEANMLYLETPIGVGFSYAKGSSAYTTTVNDEETGILNIHY